MLYSVYDTIAALSTHPGQGAIAVLRISGGEAFSIIKKIFTSPLDHALSHTAHYGKIIGADGAILDAVLVLILRNPRSYTGEDTVEISCHGSPLIVQKILKRIFEAGARPAQPGEFSQRAYLNGKIDLAQAEAVQQLIAAKNDLALQSAEQQLEGALSKKIRGFQKELTDLAAILEAWVDFPEEGLEFATMEEICSLLERICQQMAVLQATFHDGKRMHEGFSLCLLGSPNVGKSSLMNALLGSDRAIVTPIAGTTRDLLEEDLRLGPLHFRLIDTAGIRETEEVIEQEGIRRSQKAMERADLVLLLLDASQPLSDNDRHLIDSVPKEKTLFVWNKCDLDCRAEQIQAGVSISAKERIGIEELKSAIEKHIWKQGAPSKEEVMITHLRHHQALSRAINACKTVIRGLKENVSAEFVTSDLREALRQLGEITGANVTEDILSAIFSKFCLGK